MLDFIAQLEQRVQNTKLELGAAEKRSAEVSAEVERLTSAVTAYESALAAEKRMRGLPADTEQPEVAPEPEATDLLGHRKPTNGINKTAFVHDLLIKAGRAGLTGDDVYRALEKASLRVHRNYVYNIMGRLKLTGAAEQRDGRYYVKGG